MFPAWLPFIILTAVMFAVSDTLRRFFGPQINPVFSAFAVYAISALLALFAFHFFFNHETISSWQTAKKLWPFFLINGIVLAVGVSAQVHGFGLGASLSVATPILVSVVVLLASLAGLFIFGETISLRWLLGAGLVLAGVFLLLSKT